MAKIGKPKLRGPKKPVKKGDIVQFKTLIKHPMESGLRKDSTTGELIPAHFVETVLVEYLGKQVIKATWTGGVSKNPFYSFHLKAVESGEVKTTWTDNQGQSFSATAKLTVQ